MLSETFILDCMQVLMEKYKEYKEKGISEDEAFLLADQYVMDVFFKDIDYAKELAELIQKCKEIDAEITKKFGSNSSVMKDFEGITNAFKVVLDLLELPSEKTEKPKMTTSSWGGMIIEKTDNTFVCKRNT